MNIEEFTARVDAARAKNPACCYCKRDLSTASLADVMWMRGSKRIACTICPAATVVMTLPAQSQESETPCS